MQDFYDHSGHSESEYESSHGKRLDFLVSDLKLNELKNKKIIDIGCGKSFLLNRLKHTDNYLVGVDYTENTLDNKIKYYQKDLNCEFADDIIKKEGMFDVGCCFETLEHLSAGPYICVRELKKLIIEDGIIYLSIPHADCGHPVIFPGLFERDHWEQFLAQMALEILDYREHRASFVQMCYILKNKSYKHSKMTIPKPGESKFYNILPEIYVNL